jgi:hypothetical protein
MNALSAAAFAALFPVALLCAPLLLELLERKLLAPVASAAEVDVRAVLAPGLDEVDESQCEVRAGDRPGAGLDHDVVAEPAAAEPLAG